MKSLRDDLVFYLGSHMPHWLTTSPVPLFVSHRRLRARRTMPRAQCRWSLDSGGFTELAMFGGWQTTATEYADAIHRYDAEIGSLDWAAPQDWMCEPFMVDRTGLSVTEHQQRTVANLIELRSLVTDVRVVPVLQGWTLDDYHAHAGMYADAGIDLAKESTVGLGSVCRRQATGEIAQIVATMSGDYGLRLHGFGVKGDGIRRYGWMLHSADSMAWSYRGRRIKPCPHTGVSSCANCMPHALAWRERALTQSHQPVQMEMTL